MADEGPSLDEIRQQLIRLLEQDEWRITETAERTGREFLKRLLPAPGQLTIIRHLLALLKQEDWSLSSVRMGEPPGSRGVGYVVHDRMSPELYIKVIKIEGDLAWVLSFHESKHQ